MTPDHTVALGLLEAARSAKKLLERELEEPGRTVFWLLVDAIKKTEERLGHRALSDGDVS